MDKKINDMENGSSLGGQENLKGVDIEESFAPDRMADMSGNSGDDDWEINIDKLLEQADMLVSNDMLPPMAELDSENNKWPVGKESAANPENSAGTDANVVLSPGSEMDSDLDEINSLLEQANLNEKIDEDMLALLESATRNQADEDNPDEVFDIFADGDMPLEDMKSSGVPEPEEEEAGEEPKKESSRKKKKKKEKKEKKPKKASNKAVNPENGEKKSGLLAKIVALFGGGEDLEDEKPDTAADENVRILNELNGDEGNKTPKAAKKGRKKKENNKGKKSAKAEKPKAKAKKPAAAKKKKEKPTEKPAEKSVKILNGRSFTAIAGLCFSIIAGVMIVTNFIPEYIDKQNARNAFQERDYETVYKLFYDKKLSAGEELLFNQSRVIRQMERRLEAYRNNITLGRELEAVDALMNGVEKYQELWEADEYQVRNEIDALYLQICGILENNYGISREEAVAIASYDKIEYTKALYAILNGNKVSQWSGESPVSGDNSLPEAEAGSEDAQLSDDGFSEDEGLDDVLPEEEDLLN